MVVSLRAMNRLLFSCCIRHERGHAAEYKQKVQHVVMPTSTVKSVAWPAMIWVRKGELSNRDLREPKREDNLPDVVVDD